MALLLCACARPYKVCDDYTALNYTTFDPEEDIADNSLCVYGPGSKLVGNWGYTDTFTYYPPSGGAPQTSYTPHVVSMQFTGSGGSTLYITGLPSGVGINGYVYADSIVCTTLTLTVHNTNGAPQYITFPDGLTNNAQAFLIKQP